MPDISTSLISGYNAITDVNKSVPATTSTGTQTSFADIMSDSLSLLNETGTESDNATLNLITGNTNDLSTALIATEKAEIALNLTVAIRNKAVDAYKEIMNMQV